jgi:membrane protease YdiL (CAAX protease family)
MRHVDEAAGATAGEEAMSYPMSTADAAPFRPDPAGEPWKFWASTAWTVGAFLAWFAAQMLAALGLYSWWNIGQGIDLAELRQLLENGFVLALVILAAAPAKLLVFALAVRAARARITDYLALVRPHWRDLVLGFVVLAVVLPLSDLMTWLSGRAVVHPFMIDNYLAAREVGFAALLALTFAFVIAAPLTEEIAFRGFLYRGWAASALRPAGAIALTAAIWAVIHIQYETFYIVQIFVLGLIFGWLRWRSGSTLLTILLHAVVNLISVLQAAFVVELLR